MYEYRCHHFPLDLILAAFLVLTLTASCEHSSSAVSGRMIGP